MVPEHFRDLGEGIGESAHGLAEHVLDGLCGVSSLLRLDPRLVPRGTGSVDPHPGDGSDESTPGVRDQGGHDLLTWAVGVVGDGRGDSGVHQVIHELLVSITAQGCEGAGARGSETRSEDRRNGLAASLGIGRIDEVRRMAAQSIHHDLGVADGAELAGDPLQLLAESSGLLLM